MKEFLGQDFSVGSTVTFGNFEDKLLEWLVLSNDGNKAKLLCTRSVSECQHSITYYSTCHWEMSRVRRFLKYTFLPNAFNEEEQALLNECGIYGNLVTLLSEDDFNEYYNGPLHDKLHEIFNAVAVQGISRYIKLLPGMAFEKWDNWYYSYCNSRDIRRPENTTEYDFSAVPCPDNSQHILPVIEVKLQDDNTVIDLTEICCGENCTEPANRDRIRFGEEVIFGKSVGKDDFYCSSNGSLHWIVIGTAGNKVQLLCKSLLGCIEGDMGSWHDSYLHDTVLSDFKHYCFTEEERELMLAYRDMADCFERPASDDDDDEVEYIDIKDRKLICNYGADSDDLVTLLSFAELQELHSRLPSKIFKSLIVRGNGDSACYWMRPTAENNRNCYWFSEKGNCLYDSPNTRYKADDYYYLPVITVALPYEEDEQGEDEQTSTESSDQTDTARLVNTAKTKLQQDSPLAEEFINGTELKQDFSAGNTVTFGNFEGNPLEWLVLNNNGNRAKLQCKRAVGHRYLVDEFIECNETDPELETFEWQKTDVYKFLQGEFKKKAFPGGRSNLLTTCRGTEDLVTLLTLDEFKELQSRLSTKELENLYMPTYTEFNGFSLFNQHTSWLRPVEEFHWFEEQTVIAHDGGIHFDYVSLYGVCDVRPVITLDLRKLSKYKDDSTVSSDTSESLDTMDIFNVGAGDVDQSGIADMASTAETELQQDSPVSEEFVNDTESKQDFSIGNTELQKIKENSIVTFGNYKGKSLEWLVINECDGLIRLLCLDIVSKMKLVKLCYEGQLYTWEESDVVKFLNEKFMQASFSEEEINAMYTYDGVAVHSARYVFGTSEELVTVLEVGDYEKLTAEQRALLRSDNSYEWLQAIYDFSLGSQVTIADISDGSTKRASVIKACGVRPVIALLIDAVPEGSLVVKENAPADKEKSFLDEDGFDMDLAELFDNDLSYGDLLIDSGTLDEDLLDNDLSDEGLAIDSDTLVEEEEVNELDSMDIFSAIDDFSGDTICEIPVGGNPLIDVFTNKQVLAGILLNVASEYDRCAHDTVCDFIDSVNYSWVSADHVEYSGDSGDILRVTVNSSAEGYRKIVTQIFFDLTVKETADDYCDLDQAVGYHSKIVLDTIDKNGSFSRLPSIYSVWVRVRNLTPEWRNTTHNFSITGEDNNGEDVTNLVRHSDLMNVTTILLTPNYNWDADDQIIVKFLQSILNNRLYDRGFNEYLDTSNTELCEAAKTLAESLHSVDDTTRH